MFKKKKGAKKMNIPENVVMDVLSHLGSRFIHGGLTKSEGRAFIDLLQKNAPPSEGPGKYSPPQLEIQDPGGHIAPGRERLAALETELASLQGLLQSAQKPSGPALVDLDVNAIWTKVKNLEWRILFEKSLQQINYSWRS